MKQERCISLTGRNKVLFLDWDSYGKEDLVDALSNLGYEVIRIKPVMGDYLHDPEFAKEFREAIYKYQPDYVFSSNFYPVVSGVLRRKNIHYISWVYDSPLITLFSSAANNSCNYIYIFDYELFKLLCDRGVKRVFYMPMAVHTRRVEKYSITPEEQKKYKCDISFVGSLYDNKNNLFDRMAGKGLNEETKGYLLGIMEAQSRVYGEFFLEELITEKALKDMERAMPYLIPHGVDIDPSYVYANYFLGHKTTTIERRRLLSHLSEKFNVRIYTSCDTRDMPKLENMGPVDYYREMPKVFGESRINLNITLRSIHTGMPLRAVDIMGWGGFLLTNYQKDFGRHFVPGEDFVQFFSEEDMMEKCEYYLSHEKERAEIAANGARKVAKNHTMEGCLRQMFLEAKGDSF